MVFLLAIFARPLAAETGILDVFAACEASVIERSDDQLRQMGKIIEESAHRSRFRIDTEDGALVAVFVHQNALATACHLNGKHPELATEFEDTRTDWVEWEEAAVASEAWYKSALQVSGSVDLTDHAKPGFVVARCEVLKNGLVLSSQPMVANTLQRLLPAQKADRMLVLYYQFSVTTALPGRCQAAVNAHQSN